MRSAWGGLSPSQVGNVGEDAAEQVSGHRHLGHLEGGVPPHIAVSDFMRWTKGRSSRMIQQEFAHIRKRYWGKRFWARGYFSTTAGNITETVIANYLDQHINQDGFSPSA